MHYEWSPAELEQLTIEEISLQKANEQLAVFAKGIPFTFLARAATINDGIRSLTPEEISLYIRLFEEQRAEGRVTKFVPASGAATRMFKTLLYFYNTYSELSLHDLQKSKEDQKLVKELAFALENIADFAFYDDLHEVMSRDHLNIDQLLKEDNCRPVLEYLLTDKGLDYANQPKALLKFHRYENELRTALEEHIVEGIEYAQNSDKIVKIHFTISPEFLKSAQKLVLELTHKYKCELDIEFSLQKKSTNTLAVTLENTPFYSKCGKLVSRPAGHGALIENLNDLNGDIIFIKNIDNIVPDHLKNETYQYKKALGGYLAALQKQIFQYLSLLHQGKYELLDTIVSFMQNELYIEIKQDFVEWDNEKKRELIFEYLNRPIRICGMVKNSGEPGGGPFWVKSGEKLSLQIVETSQINLKDSEQAKILSQSTHFNPVDLVCGVLDFEGDQFNLLNFVDPDTAFISEKSSEGKPLKALELPGLWNGAMADWITIFVEVPLSTFNPVKTINDLLRPEHQ